MYKVYAFWATYGRAEMYMGVVDYLIQIWLKSKQVSFL